MKNLFIVITGPSGVGKTTLLNGFLKRYNKTVSRVITTTTRLERSGEYDGVDYFFISKDEFCEKLRKNEFLEFAEVYGNYYGIEKNFLINKNNTDVIICLDVQGAKTLKLKFNNEHICKSLITVFVAPKSFKVLKNRLIKRGTDDEVVVKNRIMVAKNEIECIPNFDYCIKSQSKQHDLNCLKYIYESEKLKC